MNRRVSWLALVLAGACAPIEGNGDVITETVSLESFLNLDNQSWMLVRLSAGPSAGSAVMRCDSNLLPLLELTVEEETLTLSSTTAQPINPSEPCTLDLVEGELISLRQGGSGQLSGDWLPSLAELTVDGQGSATFLSVESSSLRLTASGQGQVTLAGQVQSLNATLRVTAELSGAQLLSERATITHGSTRDLELTVSSSVEGELSSSGDARIYGLPDSRNVTSSGSGAVSYPP